MADIILDRSKDGTGEGSMNEKSGAKPNIMSEDQMVALDQFYFGVGFLTSPRFADYSERGFGSWKFFQHVKVRDTETGELKDDKKEL